MSEQVAESVASLRAALSAVKAAYSELPSSMEDEHEYNSAASRLRYMMNCLKTLIKDAWVEQMAFPSVESLAGWPQETANEAGAKFSQATRSAILDIAAGLKALIGVDASDEAKAALGEAVSEINDEVESMITGLHARRPSAVQEHRIQPEVWGAVFVQEGTSVADNRFRMLVIREGLSGNRNLWKGDVLAKATKLLEGRPIYLDHAAGAERGQPAPRSIADRVGWWSDPTYVQGLEVDGSKVNGIVATANILENSAHPWVAGMIREALQKGQPNVVGVSIDAPVTGKIRPGQDGKLFRDIESIVAFASADLVAEPGAGGQPLAVLEGLLRDEEIMELEQLTLEQLREARPDLYDTIVATVAPPAQEPPVSTQEAQPPVEDPRLTQAIEQMNATTRQLRLREQQMTIEARIVEAGLTPSMAALLRKEIGDEVRESSEIDAIFARYAEIGQAVASELGTLSARTIIPFRGNTVVEGVISPLDQVVAALDEWFFNPNPEMKGKYRSIESIKGFYVAVTGDASGGVDGVYNAKESVIGQYLGMRVTEALPGQTHIVGGSTITMASLFGLSMNRALTKKYRSQNLWWTPIVEKRALSNFKEQERTRLHSFGSLTQRSVGTEEYTELDWAETKEVYTPTGYGNLVPINRRAIINDDLEGIRRIPALLGESAATTINESHAALFTANSGGGVNLQDGVNVFNAAHQNNKLSLALDQASLEQAIIIAAGMTNDAGKAVGWRLRHLLLPIQLMPTGYRLTQSERAPGTANNDPNFIRSQWGVDNVIYVPQFNSDANNWYAMADPSEITLIETGFILGREEPEFFVQDGGTEGIVFTNDVINHKVRFEFGTDFIDYRGAVGSVVA